MTGAAAQEQPRRNQLCPCGGGRKYKLCCEPKAAVPPPARAPAPDAVAEIDLEHAFVGFGGDLSDFLQHSDAGERVVHAADVVRQLNEAWRAGLRTVLVHVDSAGGEVDGGVLLHDAFRAFRAAGGHVVVHVTGYAGSTMSWAILAADLIVARKGAWIIVHGALEGLRDEITAYKRGLYRTQTLADAQTIEQWITTPAQRNGNGAGVFRIRADDAVTLGFVDCIGGRPRARQLAEALAAGVQVSSPRRTALLARGPLPKFDTILAHLQLRAEFLRHAARTLTGEHR